MSLPNYLAKIKSSGVYRYVFDKSVVPSEYRETLRLLVGYSDKGPFNTPVYIDNASDFINTFGNISKRLEKRGSFFHRSALQALDGGPILALNLKPFVDENFGYDKFNPINVNPTAITEGKGLLLNNGVSKSEIAVNTLYDTNRFWKLDADQLPSKLGEGSFIYLTATGPKSKSCTVFMRKYTPANYDISLYEWYSNNTDQEMPEYMIGHENENLMDYFAEIFVFRGEFTENLVKEGGPLSEYFTWEDNKIYLKQDLTTATGDIADTLEALADDPNSNFIARYRGCLIPYFKDSNNKYISLDILFNNDNYTHDMLMKLNEDYLYATAEEEPNNFIRIKFTEDATYVPGQAGGSRTTGLLTYLGEGQYNPETGVPTITGSTGYIYLVPALDATENNQYTEWTYANGTWEILGGNSLTTSDIDAAITGQSDEDTEVSIAALAEGQSETPKKRLYYAYIQGYEYAVNDSTIGNSLKMLTDKGIFAALTNNVDSDYHYLVDTYKSNIETNCKQILFNVAKAKDNCLAIVNFPPMQDFIDGDSFKKDLKFDITLIGKTTDFSIVPANQGASWGAYYTPIIVSDGTIKETVPSAACVSNNFMAKYESRQPYDIVAGPKYGVISTTGLVGPDYNYSRADLDVLEPLGVNAIVYVPRKGTYINSNQTAKQVPVSALSKVHVRELVIYLQDEIESLLQSYQWDKNTASLRATIKAKADTILENVMQNDGVYAYVNTCDETNNTNEVIDNEMIILDTDIEPARGAGKLVQRLTIHKTGGITTTSNKI